MDCFEHLSIELENKNNSLLSWVNWVQISTVCIAGGKWHVSYERV